MKDGFNREIKYARISVTDLCNLRCRYCMPDGVQKKLHSDILSIEELAEISDALATLGVSKQRITGGEPLARKGLFELLSHMGKNEKIHELDITTNGQKLGEEAAQLRELGVDRVNVSIDTLDKAKYRVLTGGGDLSRALDGLDSALSVGFEVKLNAVLLRGINDKEIRTLAEFAADKKIVLRFIELMPFADRKEYAKEYFISAKEVVKVNNLSKATNNASDDKAVEYMFDDGLSLRIISPLSDCFCRYCNRIRITADGKLLNCLHESKEYDLKPYLHTDELCGFIEECVADKPERHRLTDGVLQRRAMEKIGG